MTDERDTTGKSRDTPERINEPLPQQQRVSMSLRPSRIRWRNRHTVKVLESALAAFRAIREVKLEYLEHQKVDVQLDELDSILGADRARLKTERQRQENDLVEEKQRAERLELEGKLQMSELKYQLKHTNRMLRELNAQERRRKSNKGARDESAPEPDEPDEPV